MKYSARMVLVLMVLAYFTYFSFFSILRHRSFNSEQYDLGIMDQTIYNSAHGRLFQLTDPVGFKTISRFAIHADFFLVLLSPLYLIFNGVEILLIFQTAAIGLGAIGVYLISKKILNSPLISLTLAFCYLLYPALQWSNIFDFHAVTLSTTFILFMYFFALEHRYKLAIIFFILAILTKEQVGITLALMGLIFLKKSDGKRFGFIVITIGTLWFIFSVWFLIPHFRREDHFAVQRFSDFGSTSTNIVLGVLTKPRVVIPKIINSQAVDYVKQLLSPLFYTPVASPEILILATPELLINFLSNESNMKGIIHHYTSVLTPFIFIAAIYGIKRLGKIKYINEKVVVFALVLSASYGALNYSPLPFSKWAELRPFAFNRDDYKNVGRWKNELQDETIIVSASGGLYPHFSHRKTIIRLSENYTQADYVVLFKDQAISDWFNGPGSLKAYNSLVNDANFSLVEKKDRLEVYKKI